MSEKMVTTHIFLPHKIIWSRKKELKSESRVFFSFFFGGGLVGISN